MLAMNVRTVMLGAPEGIYVTHMKRTHMFDTCDDEQAITRHGETDLRNTPRQSSRTKISSAVQGKSEIRTHRYLGLVDEFRSKKWILCMRFQQGPIHQKVLG